MMRSFVGVSELEPRQSSRVIKLTQPLDFVRPANPCRIFALLQINHGVVLAFRQSIG